MGMAVSVPQYTVDDLETFPEDGNRYELLDGVLLVTPAPRPEHQVVVSRLQVAFGFALVLPAHAHVVGPGAVTLPPRTQLAPDLLVYPARFAPTTPWSEITEHWLAVEILSPSSHVYDREFKRDAYHALGVPEVWLVDIDARTVETSRATDGHAPWREVVRTEVRWKPPVAAAGVTVTISLDELFAGTE